MNSSFTLNLEAALIAYLTPLCQFAESVTGMSDRAHADEEQYGVLGEYVAVPAVIARTRAASQSPKRRHHTIVTAMPISQSTQKEPNSVTTRIAVSSPVERWSTTTSRMRWNAQ